jgi:hypothetical protein
MKRKKPVTTKAKKPVLTKAKKPATQKPKTQATPIRSSLRKESNLHKRCSPGSLQSQAPI